MHNEEKWKAQTRNPTGRTDAVTEKSCEETYQKNNQPQNSKINMCQFNVDLINSKTKQIQAEKHLFTLFLSLSLNSQVWKVNEHRRDLEQNKRWCLQGNIKTSGKTSEHIFT